MQTEMNKLFAEGGVMQEGGTVDPVSGNDVPPGAMKEEVRDDVDAKLSEGEFVIPADVVRYIGLETLMKLRDKAKMGLKKMEDIGQMGNAESVPDAEALHGGEDNGMDDESFSSEIDSILGEDNGEEKEYAAGGYVAPTSAQISGEQNQQVSADYAATEDTKKYANAPIKGFEMVPMMNDAGQTIYIPFINGTPQLSVPEGYKVKKAGDVSATATTPTAPVTSGDTTAGDSAGSATPAGPSGPSTSGLGLGGIGMGDVTISDEGVVSGGKVSSVAGGLMGAVVGTVLGVGPIVGYKAGSKAADVFSAKNATTIAASNAAIADTMGENAVNLGDIPAAITASQSKAGMEGVTGGSVANTGATAAQAATEAGYSPEAVGAAAQAAADAVRGGASESQAQAAGAVAASNVDGAKGGAGTTGAMQGGFGTTPSTTETTDDTENTTETTTPADTTTTETTTTESTTTDSTTTDSTESTSLAKGGFVSKPKKTMIKPKGLAGRRK